MSVVTGAHTVWVYVWEDDNVFNQQPSNNTPSDASNENWKIFGSGETMDSQDRDNNPERLYRPFDRAAHDIIEQAFDGSWSADYTLTNSWWLQFIYGEPEVSGSGPYTHTYTFDPRSPPKSAHLVEEVHYPDGEIEQTIYTGCVVSSGDVDVSVEDTVGVSLDGAYATEHVRNTAEGEALLYGDSTSGIGAQPETQYRPLHFGNSFLRLATGGAGSPVMQSLVQDASVSLEGNVELENELGTRFAAAPSYLNFEFDVSYTKLVNVDSKDEEKRSMYGSEAAQSPQESMADSDIDGELEFDAGLAGESNNITLETVGNFPETYNRNNVGSPEDPTEEDISRYIEDVVAVVETDQSTPA